MTTNDEYQQALGDRLRAIRQQQGLTLQQVEERSGGQWKAVVVGSYERGDRAVSVSKLAQLAEFYGVPVGELLPERSERGAADSGSIDRVVLDLTRLSGAKLPQSVYEPLIRYATTIQVQRGDYNGRMLSLRRDDVQALAIVIGREPEALLDELSDQGLVRLG
ncbi:MAG: transcriptional regulator [Actinobacteria bacterium]|nr:transcriptional regulator [Actinomycetota bacterium]